ncbi:hypothetical protein ACQ4PT_016029 [Festuca glaucescens]
MAKKRSKRTTAASSSKSNMVVDWSALRHDLVRVIGDLLLATNDVDSYLCMRAVCSNWRTAIPKPTPLGAGDDLRFRPREWVILEQEKHWYGDSGELFLNVSTGRFLRVRLPQLNSAILVGASDGLLVLGDEKGLHAARLLNPFTGEMLPFAAPIPWETEVKTAVAGTTPTLLFTFLDACGGNFDMVYCAHRTSMLCEVQFEDCFQNEFELGSAVSYAGHLYTVGYNGGIYKITGMAPNYRGELIERTFTDGERCYLVVSADQLLLVMQGYFRESAKDPFPLEVYIVDVDRKVLEPVTNIGSRALFLGPRCLSLDLNSDLRKSDDGNWLKAVDANCIYYFDDLLPPRDGFFRTISRYDLSNMNEERISCVVPETEIQIRPFSIAQTLLEYCTCHPNIRKQISRLQ